MTLSATSGTADFAKRIVVGSLALMITATSKLSMDGIGNEFVLILSHSTPKFMPFSFAATSLSPLDYETEIVLLKLRFGFLARLAPIPFDAINCMNWAISNASVLVIIGVL